MGKTWAGIDPGKTGAIVIVGPRLVDMVITLPTTTEKGSAGYDVPRLYQWLGTLRECEVVGVEWPSARPGEGAQRSLHFGLGLGYLEMGMHAAQVTYQKVSPQKWKRDLGLPGKTNKDAIKLAAAMFDGLFPGQSSLIRGPRGGIKDGLCEAALIAHYMRSRS